MSVEQTAQVLTEMLNNSEYPAAIAADPQKCFASWDLTDRERQLLTEEAGADVRAYSGPNSPSLAYIADGQPLSQPVGTALGNALGRVLSLPIMGPATGGCD